MYQIAKSEKPSMQQMTLSQLERRRLQTAVGGIAAPTEKVGPSLSHQTSFASTTVSRGPPAIFTPAVGTSFNASLDSAATSFPEEDTKEHSQDYFPTQDVMEIEADDEFNTSFHNLCEPTKADLLFDELCKKTPFKNAELGVDHKLSFPHRYELERVANALHITPKELLSDLRKEGISSSSKEFDTFWDAGRKVAKRRKGQLPERPSSMAWNCALGSFFENEARDRSVYLGGALSFKTKTDESIFDFKLKPLQMDTSCRFHRKYGPSRFMVLSLPCLTAEAPPKLREKARSGALTESVARWLTTDHVFLGRKWKVFWEELDKKKSKTTNQAGGHKIHLFAVSGEDIPAESIVEIDQFLNWHIPFEHNLKSTNLKLFQRLKLGVSKTYSTITLDASEFIRLPDPVDHAVMNDGCARMSMTLARDVAQHLGLGEVPSVFQGRIAGAKGLWMVVSDDHFGKIGERKYLVEISDSQLKIDPHPKDNSAADEFQRTFEVASYSKPGKPGALNKQLLTILHDRGVPREVLGELLMADIGKSFEALELSMQFSPQLRAWVQSSEKYSRAAADVRMTGSWPNDLEEQAIMLIEGGFTPDSNHMLRECLRSILFNHLTRYVERLQICIPCSTYLFCIADPYGVLEENEVHLSFSEVWSDPISGFKESFVDGRDVLVARLPAYLPSDIQRRQAVWKRELHHFKDVIVFSTKGDLPLAGMLSGGDYDGDAPWICWDPNVVNHFRNANLPEMPEKKDCGLVPRSRKLEDVFSRGTSKERLVYQVTSFLSGCLEFNLNPSYLGYCSAEHEKVVYFDGKLSTQSAIKLATLCGYLVDSPKQGDLLTETAWQKLRKEVSPRSRDAPAYKSDKSEHLKRESNIIDYLKFWRAVPEKDRILTQFNKLCPQQSSRDQTLCQPWTSMFTYARSKDASDSLREMLEQLQTEVKELLEELDRQRPRDNNWPPGEYNRVMDNFWRQFRAIIPPKDHELAHWLEYGEDKKFGRWSLVRASYLYNLRYSSRSVWHLAGEELCSIKAQANPNGCRHVVNDIYGVLKCDSRVAKRARARLDGDDIEEPALGQEDEDEITDSW